MRLSSDSPGILLIGYGNPARADDGLGPALAARIGKASIKRLTVDADYQLTIENSCEIAKYDIVIFADASVDQKEPFFFREILPESPMSISTHSVSPGAVLHFARMIFNAETKAYVLGIRGYEFNVFDERLSEGAESNLEAAFKFIVNMVRSGNFP